MGRAPVRGARPETVLPAFGFDYVPATSPPGSPLSWSRACSTRSLVAYSVKGVGTSRGTRRTIGHVMGQRQAWENGRLVASRFGATTRGALPVRRARRRRVGGTEPLTVPRHTDVRNVRSYIRAPVIAAKAGGLGRLRRAARPARLAVWPAGAVGESGKSRFAVVAEARGPGGEGRAVVEGTDVYGLTARLIVVGAQALDAGEARGTGVLAPAEAFDARTLAGRLEPFLTIAD